MTWGNTNKHRSAQETGKLVMSESVKSSLTGGVRTVYCQYLTLSWLCSWEDNHSTGITVTQCCLQERYGNWSKWKNYRSVNENGKMENETVQLSRTESKLKCIITKQI